MPSKKKRDQPESNSENSSGEEVETKPSKTSPKQSSTSPKQATSPKSSKSTLPTNKLQSSSDESTSSEASSDDAKPSKTSEKKSSSSQQKVSSPSTKKEDSSKKESQETSKKSSSSSKKPAPQQSSSEESSEDTSEPTSSEDDQKAPPAKSPSKKEAVSPKPATSSPSQSSKPSSTPQASSVPQSAWISTPQTPPAQSKSPSRSKSAPKQSSSESEGTQSDSEEEEEASKPKKATSPKSAPSSSSKSGSTSVIPASNSSATPSQKSKPEEGGLTKAVSQTFHAPKKNGKGSDSGSEDEEVTEKNVVEVLKKQQKKISKLSLENRNLQREVSVLQRLIEATMTEKDEIAKAGKLEKKDPIEGKWEECYVTVVKGGYLKIYAHEGDKLPIELVDLSKAIIYGQVEKNGKAKPLFFNIRAQDKTDHLFRVEDKIKKGEWIQSLRSTAKAAKEGPPPVPAIQPHEMRKTQSEIMHKKGLVQRLSGVLNVGKKNDD